MPKKLTPDEKRHHAKVRQLPCCAGWDHNGGIVHHLREHTGMGVRPSHYRVVPICGRHHTEQHPNSYSIHMNPIEFHKVYGSNEELLVQTLARLEEMDIL